MNTNRHSMLTEQQWRDQSGELVALREAHAAWRWSHALRAHATGRGGLGTPYTSAEPDHLGERIRCLEESLSRADIVDTTGGPAEIVRVGSRVRVRWVDSAEEEYVVVTPPELELRSGHISYETPVGRAVLGRRSGETVVLKAVSGAMPLHILRVSPPITITIPPGTPLISRIATMWSMLWAASGAASSPRGLNWKTWKPESFALGSSG
jgi:transcription elongation factor GreA